MTRKAIWVAILLALAVRLYGIFWGLPYFYAIDEEDIVGKAIGYVTTGDWSPHKFSHPASTLRYILGLVFQGAAWLRAALDSSFSTASFAAWALEDPTFFYVAGRALTMLCAALTVCLVYRIGALAFRPRVGLYAALLLAASYLHVRLSLLATSDVPLTFFVTLLAWLALRLAQEDRTSLYVTAGIALGAGLATKYPALIAALPILAAHLSRPQPGSTAWRRLLDIRLWGCFALALVVFVALTPFFLPELETALASIRAEFRADHVGANRLPGLQNYWWYFREPLSWGYGWLIELLAAAGLLIALRRPKRADGVLLAFMVPFYLVIANGSLRWARWIAPLLPFLALYAGLALDRLAALLDGRPLARRWPSWAWGVLLPLLIVAPMVRSDLQAIRELNREDTRTLATRWIEAHIAVGARIVHEAYTARVLPTRYDVLAVDTLGRQPIAAYARDGYAYALASSRMYDRYLAEATQYPAHAATYRDLFACGELLHEVAPVEGVTQGPTVRVYALAGCAP